ncbi:alpha/beta hydrolase [Aeromicrobium fastidiosum]|uniref:Alpha/beta hydrolase n=1 Tax=Aeromicrobium fastidiosum TaxID=52699 RepID=A0A641ARX5_9ACTN|nr:alpha/beta hydrolase [Aeromicrobium fastidiosum]KAA1380699.1 alpha/beta hydrolase [Aeromicrobium fastidiosum]MBP2390311.1 alpha-beta hydrolase superfamily lysophospholipase [Aeromicrobium fastidiosum]
MTRWVPDELGDGYEQHTIPLGDDPDGEGVVEATLVRRAAPEDVRAAVIYVHGFSDYFFQKEMADFFAERGFAFYALDLRKCGRSRRDGQTGHYVSDLALYDAELDAALEIVREETAGVPVLLSAHSTGGLIVPLWLDRLNRRPGGTRGAGVSGVVLNSPWFDLQGKPWMRTVGTQVIGLVAKVRPTAMMKLPATDAYGTSLHVSGHGEWEFNTVFKPLNGFPVAYGWLTAVRRGHARLHRGLDIGVPSLVLRSTKSRFARAWSPEVDEADAVLDVKQIARWAGCLGDAVTVVPVDKARHDVFISKAEPREAAYAAVDAWMRAQGITS